MKTYKYVAVLPSTQVKCESNFPKLRLTKTYLRSQLAQQTLEDVMIISTEADLFETINIDEIISEVVASSQKISSFVRA